jgi:hypothetical protein
MIRLFIARGAARAVSLEERVLMCVSECSGGYRSLLPSHSKARASCRHREKGHLEGNFRRSVEPDKNPHQSDQSHAMQEIDESSVRA